MKWIQRSEQEKATDFCRNWQANSRIYMEVQKEEKNLKYTWKIIGGNILSVCKTYYKAIVHIKKVVDK